MFLAMYYWAGVNNIRSYLQVQSEVHAQDTATSLGLSLSRCAAFGAATPGPNQRAGAQHLDIRIVAESVRTNEDLEAALFGASRGKPE